MKAILVFIQRIFAPQSMRLWKQSYTELGAVAVTIGAMVASFKAKDFGSLLNQAPEFWAEMGILLVAVRGIFSSNREAIANPAATHITGVTFPVIAPKIEPIDAVKIPVPDDSASVIEEIHPVDPIS